MAMAMAKAESLGGESLIGLSGGGPVIARLLVRSGSLCPHFYSLSRLGRLALVARVCAKVVFSCSLFFFGSWFGWLVGWLVGRQGGQEKKLMGMTQMTKTISN